MPHVFKINEVIDCCNSINMTTSSYVHCGTKTM